MPPWHGNPALQNSKAGAGVFPHTELSAVGSLSNTDLSHPSTRGLEYPGSQINHEKSKTKAHFLVVKQETNPKADLGAETATQVPPPFLFVWLPLFVEGRFSAASGVTGKRRRRAVQRQSRANGRPRSPERKVVFP